VDHDRLYRLQPSESMASANARSMNRNQREGATMDRGRLNVPDRVRSASPNRRAVLACDRERAAGDHEVAARDFDRIDRAHANLTLLHPDHRTTNTRSRCDIGLVDPQQTKCDVPTKRRTAANASASRAHQRTERAALDVNQTDTVVIARR
jgi:hypothetical protein